MARGTYVTMWVVYDHPTDYPDCYVARKFANDSPTQDFVIGPELELEQLRGWLAGQGMVCLTRDPEDEPHIVEVWL